MALPAQNAVKADWEQALSELGVSDEWLTEDENGKARTKDDLITVGRAIRDGELVVDLWGGHLDEARTAPWQRDTIVAVFSAERSRCVWPKRERVTWRT